MAPIPSLALAVSLLIGCGGVQPRHAIADVAPCAVDGLPEHVVCEAAFAQTPSDVAHFQSRTFVAFSQPTTPDSASVFELVDGGLAPYPASHSADDALRSVAALHVDRRGWLWVLGDGLSQTASTVMVWNTVDDREVFRHTFAAAEDTTLDDLVVDEDAGFAYIAVSRSDGVPSLMVFEVPRARVRTVQIDAPTIIFEPAATPSSTLVEAVGARSMALSADHETLYVGAANSAQLYMLETQLLRDPSVTEANCPGGTTPLPAPLAGGLGVAEDGALLVTSIARGGVERLVLGEEASAVATHPAMSAPTGLTVAEGTAYMTSVQHGTSYLWRIALPAE